MQKSKPRILILSVQVPFTSGGAELLVDRLKQQIGNSGVLVDVVQIPFSAIPKESLIQQMAYWRALDLTSFNGQLVDAVICTKFPSYLVCHPNKVLWLIHQYRQAYDLYGTRFGDLTTSDEDEALRQMIYQADIVGLKECKAIYSISDNVRERLQRSLGVDSETLIPPLPLAGSYYHGVAQPYILSVGRICSIKRVDLIIKAMATIDEALKLKIVGLPDESEIESYINSEIKKHNLWHRVEFLGRVSENQLLELYANAFFVYYAPFDEDLGFVTLESLSSGVPVITATDSGGSLAFIDDHKNGLVVEPNEFAVAKALNEVFHNHTLYAQLREGAQTLEFCSRWDDVLKKLILL